MPGMAIPGAAIAGPATPAIGSAAPQTTTLNLTPPPDAAPPSIAATSQIKNLYGAAHLVLSEDGLRSRA